MPSIAASVVRSCSSFNRKLLDKSGCSEGLLYGEFMLCRFYTITVVIITTLQSMHEHYYYGLVLLTPRYSHQHFRAKQQRQHHSHNHSTPRHSFPGTRTAEIAAEDSPPASPVNRYARIDA